MPTPLLFPLNAGEHGRWTAVLSRRAFRLGRGLLRFPDNALQNAPRNHPLP